MCKRKYELETILDVLNMADEIGATQTAIKLNIPINTVNGWRRVKSMPEIYPNHIITRHFQDLGHSNPTVTEIYASPDKITEMYTSPEKIEIKAENNSASVELKVDVKPDVTKEIKGSYEQLHNNSRSYMPEFKEFAVALADKIGDEAATVELGLRNHHIANWRSNLNCELKEARRIIQVLQTDKKELQKQVDNLNKRLTKAMTAEYENEQFRKYITSRITDEVVASILQN